MAIAVDATTLDPFTPCQLATSRTWIAGKLLGLDARMAFDGTGWLEGAMLPGASAGRYRLDTAEAALAHALLALETTDCRRSALEHGFCPAPASGFDGVGLAVAARNHRTSCSQTEQISARIR